MAVVVPIMSSVLKCRNTTILFPAVVGNITRQFLTSLSKSMDVLYLAYMLWNTITTHQVHGAGLGGQCLLRAWHPPVLVLLCHQAFLC